MPLPAIAAWLTWETAAMVAGAIASAKVAYDSYYMIPEVNIAVVGLRRTGKTVFLTSLINHFKEADDSTGQFWDSKNIQFVAKDVPDEDLPLSKVFPYNDILAGYQNEPPSWPNETTDVYHFTLVLEYKIGGSKPKKIKLNFIDYPGERIADYSMVNANYEQWVRELNGNQKAYHKELFDLWTDDLNSSSSAILDGTIKFETLFGKYFNHIRLLKQKGFFYLQPGELAIAKEIDAVNEQAKFVPLPIEYKSTPIYREMEKRFKAYRAKVKDFYRLLSFFQYAVVLVDIKRILKEGFHVYNDYLTILESILAHMPWDDNQVKRMMADIPIAERIITNIPLVGKYLRRKIVGQPIKKVIFVATKADTVVAHQRANMIKLLRDMVEQSAKAIKFHVQKVSFDYCSANRCTEDLKVSESDGERTILAIRKGGDPFEIENPGEIPDKWPGDSDWDELRKAQFGNHAFEPKPISKRRGAVIPSINFLPLLWNLIQGEFYG